MDQREQIQLADNIAKGRLSQIEASYVALCVAHALARGVTQKIGTYGVEVVEGAAKAPAPAPDPGIMTFEPVRRVSGAS